MPQRHAKKNRNNKPQCPSCHRGYLLSQSPHLMNFTKGIVVFSCRFCHRELETLSFKEWNAFHQEKELKNKPRETPPPTQGKKSGRRFPPEKKREPKKEPAPENKGIASERFYQSNLPD